MRNRFLISVGLSDLGALGGSVMVASWIVFGSPWIWEVSAPGPVWPMVGFLAASLIATSLLTAQMSGHGVPRVSYGRMLMILGGTVFFTAGLLVLFRDVYFSRAFLAWSSVVWLAPATAHRVTRQTRPWTERIGVITREKQLADDLAEADHAEVLWALAPDFDGSIDLGNTLFFVLLLTLIVTLFDRYRQVYLRRFATND